MKFTIFILLMGLMISGCEQKPEPWFESNSSIRFKYRMTDEVIAQPIKVIHYSFGQAPEEQLLDTILLTVTFTGPLADYDREYQIETADTGVIVEKHTTMKEGEDFWFPSKPFIIPSGCWVDTLPVVISRQHITPGFMKKETKTVVLKLVKNENFGEIVEGMDEMAIVVNNYLAQPVWWRPALNYYHPEKYKYLMTLQPLLKNAEKLEVSIVELELLVPTLKEYLDNNIVLDEETGKRVLFDQLVDYVPDHVE